MVTFLKSFTFPSDGAENSFFDGQKRTCFQTYYPFQVLTHRGLPEIIFEPVTILYGGNGSGKTTMLNVMAEKLRAYRDSAFNQTNFFQDYIDLCSMEAGKKRPENCCIITSDDVFDYMLNIRSLNSGIHLKRDELFQDYTQAKYAHFQMNSLEDYEELKKHNAAKRLSQSKFVGARLTDNVREYSNGESAYLYFTEKIKENGLYLLDEPENSLSPQRQMELTQFLLDSARFYGCQFIISTHSPFLLSLKGARIYDLDASPVQVRKWTELENVKIYHEFFCVHEKEFS